jgi:hypothetical protein
MGNRLGCDGWLIDVEVAMRAKSGWGIRGISVLIIAVMVCAGIAGAKRTGQLIGWGDNNLMPAGNDYVAIAAGSFHGLALRTDGSIVGWGANTYGQATPPSGNDFISIAAHFESSLALKSDGTIVGWGNNSANHVTSPGGNDYVAIAIGAYHSLALKANGSIIGWGDNNYGQASPPTGNDYVAIAAGGFFGLALKSDGSIVGWGDTSYGQTTPPAGNDYIAIAAGGFHSIALKSDGSILCWGAGQSGQSGNVHYGQSIPPVGNNYVAITAGLYHSLAIKSDGTMIGWGENTSGQAVPPSGKSYIAIVGGGRMSIALKFDDTIEQEDLNSDGVVNLEDWGEFAGQWGKVCRNPMMCGCADFDGNRKVDLGDLMTFAEKWIRNWIDYPTVFWPFDGTYLSDKGVYAGVPYGDPEFVSGSDARIGSGAIELDGNDYVVTNGFIGIPGRSARTCMAWIKTTGTIAPIVYWGNKNIPGGTWEMRINSVGQLRAQMNGCGINGVSSVNTGQWVHVAAVLPEGGNSTAVVQLYVNGVWETGAMTAGTINTIPVAAMRIGADETGKYFRGLIDDVRIYDRALAAAEIAGIAGQ